MPPAGFEPATPALGFDPGAARQGPSPIGTYVPGRAYVSTSGAVDVTCGCQGRSGLVASESKEGGRGGDLAAVRQGEHDASGIPAVVVRRFPDLGDRFLPLPLLDQLSRSLLREPWDGDLEARMMSASQRCRRARRIRIHVPIDRFIASPSSTRGGL